MSKLTKTNNFRVNLLNRSNTSKPYHFACYHNKKKLRPWVCVDMVWDYWLMIGIGVGVWMGDL